MDFNELKEKLAAKASGRLEKLFLYTRTDSEEVKRKVKRNAYIASGACLCVVLLIFAVMLSFSCTYSAGTEKTGSDIVYVRVAPGMSSDEIGTLLADNGIIDSKLKFWLAVKLNGADSKFQVGIFGLQKNMQPGEALNVLINGHSAAMRVTVPEGLNIREVARIFAEKGLVDEKEFLAEAKTFAPYDYIEAVPEADYRIEGFLFPDTYDFANDVGPREIMQKMADEFDAKLTPELRRKAAEQRLSIYELVTLASLVEKEARYPEDRPIIAQVFLKRLRIDMPLQTDTTLQYLLQDAKEDLTIADTKIDSPYNTYQNYGLPPGPIASPGLASIEAVLNPADTDYLYFVADRQGHNHYGYTYDEHTDLVEQVR